MWNLNAILLPFLKIISSIKQIFLFMMTSHQIYSSALFNPLPFKTCCRLQHMINMLTFKRPGLCGWLQPIQFKPWLDWVGSAAQVQRYCVDSVAQAFIHALAGCVPHGIQYALCGPHNSWSAHFAAHTLDVLAIWYDTKIFSFHKRKFFTYPGQYLEDYAMLW